MRKALRAAFGTALVVDPAGAMIAGAWDACTEPPAPGTALINPDCLQNDTAPYLVPLGDGLSIAAMVPAESDHPPKPPRTAAARTVAIKTVARIWIRGGDVP